MLCLAKFRGLHKSTKEDSTAMITVRPYRSWTTCACACACACAKCADCRGKKTFWAGL